MNFYALTYYYNMFGRIPRVYDLISHSTLVAVDLFAADLLDSLYTEICLYKNGIMVARQATYQGV